MNVWAIGDLHLSFDPRIEKPMDIFGGSWVGHDKKVKEIWERLVEPEDLVILAGDISWALRLEEALEDLKWIDALPGTKLILKGNHDLWWSGISKVKNACKDLESLHFLQHDAYVFGRAVVFGTRGWTCPGAKDYKEEEDGAIYRREVMRLSMSLAEARKAVQSVEQETGKKAYLIGAMHYPPRNEKFEPSGFSELLESSGAAQVVYGHLHGQNAFKNGLQGIFNGVEYSLVSLDKLACCPKLIYREE
ncbi:MAG: metallophosphoesterase [Firmicutes bacterium]|nr:metallophosphoesterase [Bacillota bacterium]